MVGQEGMTRPSGQPYALTIAEAGALLRKRKLSPLELVDSLLQRIEETEGRLRAYVAVPFDSVREAARSAEREIARGGWRSPLHGIPVALKDVFHAVGMPTEAGSKTLKGFLPTGDSGVTIRLREDGAIILGKTVMPEFAYRSYPADLPRTRNPWNLEYHPGGSSAGSAVAVAADSAMGAMGTDTGGSIRYPASMTGIVGLKPTFGRVTRRGVVPMCSTMDHCGPLAKTVEDAALILNAIAGYDPQDPTSIDAPIQNYKEALNGSVKGLRLGIERRHFFSGAVIPPVRQAVEGALRVLRELGCIVVDIEIPYIECATVAGGILLMADMSSYHWNWLRERSDEYEPGTRLMLRLGELISARDYLLAVRARRQFKTAMREVFDIHRLNALVTPTHFGTAIPLAERFPHPVATDDETIEVKFNHHLMPFNLTGQPALTVPCGFNDTDLPVGLQIVGRPFDEATILRIGKAYESVTTWHEKSPPI